MLDYLALIGVCTVLAYVIQTRMTRYGSTILCIREDMQSKVVYFCIIISLIMFAGLRTSYNDTSTYMFGFQILSPESVSYGDIFSPYGGFDVYQKLIKQYIGDDPQIFIFVSSIVTTLLYVPFIARHTRRFGESVFLFLIGSYLFSMAGIKQSIAIGIALYAISSYIRKKYIRALFLLLLAMTFHPYIICLVCIVALMKQVWSVKCVLLIILFAVLFLNLDSLFGLLSAIGKDYSMEDMSNYTINPMRVVVQAAPIILSILSRHKLNQSKDPYVILGINMQVIGFAFIALGLFFNPIYLGRMSTYFDALSCIAIPQLLNLTFENYSRKKLWITAYYGFWGLYFLLDMTKLGSISILYDQFRHTSITELFF